MISSVNPRPSTSREYYPAYEYYRNKLQIDSNQDSGFFVKEKQLLTNAGGPARRRTLSAYTGNPGVEGIVTNSVIKLLLTVIFIIISTGDEEAFTEHTCAIFDVR